MNLIETLEQALEALEVVAKYGNVFAYKTYEQNPYEQITKAITNLHTAIEQAKEVEPVAHTGATQIGDTC